MSTEHLPITPRQRLRNALRKPAVVIAAVALALLVWQWLETRSRLDFLQEELARRLAAADASAQESRALAKQGQESLLSLQGKVGALEANLAQAQSQQLALEAMYQELSRSRDERLLAEIEQSLAIAAQQLQLAGNAEAALIALQSADARLARAAQPQLLPLRKLINRDMDRLKALPLADISGVAVKLEGLVASVDTLPLAFEQRPKPAAGNARKEPAGSRWEALWAEWWREVRQLVRVERVDRADPTLISPSQAFFLRENLKLRLVNARLALLSRDGRSFRDDLRQAGEWLDRYFDGRNRAVQSAQTTVKGLAALDIARDLPALDDTLNAVRNFKLPRDKR
ncbi:MAG: uroporphyrinogen-III C-methyltransferase [Rhodocyclaceae bacterium]|nr:uroporphyrinogen-III C-methyltransferase [Rhodocyclaceae bacterium]